MDPFLPSIPTIMDPNHNQDQHIMDSPHIVDLNNMESQMADTNMILMDTHMDRNSIYTNTINQTQPTKDTTNKTDHPDRKWAQ